MAKINQKLVTINEALETLKTSIELLGEYETIMIIAPSERNEHIFLAMRDSGIFTI